MPADQPVSAADCRDVAVGQVGEDLYLYSMSEADSRIDAFRIDPLTGISKPLEGSTPVPTGANPLRIELLERFD